jgi:hypothetical protein
MNEEKARAMALEIIEKVRERIRKQRARVRTGVVPNLDRLAKAIQTYTAARYITNPEVWPKRHYPYDYTEVEVEWNDEEWQAHLYRNYTRVDLPLVEKVMPPRGSDYLQRRDGVIELVKKRMRLRRDPASGVYLTEGYRPPEEILRPQLLAPSRWSYIEPSSTFTPRNSQRCCTTTTRKSGSICATSSTRLASPPAAVRCSLTS